jgi:DNA modification methylase
MKTIDQITTDEYALYNGDCVDLVKAIPDESIGLSVFSPPFPGMYAYSDSTRDMGNVRSQEEMIEHFKFLVPELLRITWPGRSCCVHLCQGVAFLGADGYIGIKDFRGAIIRTMEDAGWIYYGEVCIEKNPQIKAIRTKDAGLLFKSLANDSARMHMALADYVLQFRKPGENPQPIKAGISEAYDNVDGWITSEEWITWASPIWWMKSERNPDGISETNVLSNYREGREEDDEKHLCPLQLDVIERCVKLWSAPGETVFSPFAGIGSEGYVSLKLKRKFVGIELKPSYYNVACENLERAIRERDAEGMELFEYAEVENGTP